MSVKMKRRLPIAAPALCLVVGFTISLWHSIDARAENAASTADKRPSMSLNIKEVNDLSTTGAGVAVAWSPDGSKIVAASNFGQELSVWDRSGRLVNRFHRIGGGPALGGAIAFVDNSSQIVFLPPADASNDAALSIWAVATGEVVHSIDGPEPGMNYDFNRGKHFAVSSDQKTLISASITGGKATPVPHGNLISYGTTDWKRLSVFKIDAGVSSVCIFADGKLAAAGLSSGRVALIDLTNKLPIKQVPVFDPANSGILFVGSVAGSHDGRFLAVGAGLVSPNYFKGADGSDGGQSVAAVRLLRVSDGTPVASLGPARPPIRQIAWDPMGRYVALIDSHESLYVWQPDISPNRYKQVKVTGLTLSLAISSDGSEIAVSTSKGVRVFSVTEEQ